MALRAEGVAEWPVSELQLPGQGGPGFAFALSAGSFNLEAVPWVTRQSSVSSMQKPTTRTLANIFQSTHSVLGKRSMWLGVCFSLIKVMKYFRHTELCTG